MLTALSSGCSDGGSSNEVAAEDGNPVVEDPLFQNTTLTNFDISVPAYQSDTLQVQLRWGDRNFFAKWVGNEIWSASAQLPTNTQNILNVIFSDRNGAVTLGSFETFYSTGASTSAYLQITASDFNTKKWDADMDGVSNLDELTGGTDPFVDNELELELREPYDLRNHRDLVNRLEFSLPEERPYFEDSVDQQPPVFKIGDDNIKIIQNIELNASGSGTINYVREFKSSNNDQQIEHVLTRINDQNSITWSGSHKLVSASAALFETKDFTITTTVLGDRLREQIGVLEETTVVGRQSKLSLEYQLSGRVIDASNLCEPVAGSLQHNYWFTSEGLGNPDLALTLTKELDDLYWTASKEDKNPPLIQNFWVESIGSFYCELADQ